MLTAFLSIVVLGLLWFVLFNHRLTNAILRTYHKTNLPFYNDLCRTLARRWQSQNRQRGYHLARASRTARRETARQLARAAVV